MMRRLVMAVGMILAAGYVFAGEKSNAKHEDPEMVVSATKLESQAGSIASSVTVLSGADLDMEKNTTVIDVLRSVPGVHVSQNGGVGTTANIFIRGGSSDHVLVLVDGIEMNDPVSPGRGAYLANMALENVQRVEVLRGSQSGIYGSDAIAGVVSITTRKGVGPVGGYLTAEAGSFGTFTESAGVSGGTDKYNYSFSITRIDSEGISAADEDDGNTEEDSFKNTSASARLGYAACDSAEFSIFARMVDSENEFDAGGGPGGDAEDNVAKRKSYYLRALGEISLLDSAWQQEIGAAVSLHDRTSESAWGNTDFDSQLIKIDWLNSFFIGDANVLTVGAEFEREEGKTTSFDRHEADTWSVFAHDQADIGDDLSVGLSGRLDSHEEFGSELTYRLGPVYRLDEIGTRLRATYGTGFKSPSLYQLYAPASVWGPVGNENLDPETSSGWDVGIEQGIDEERIVLGAVWYSTEYKDLIEYEMGYVNKSEAVMEGLELYADVEVSDSLTVSVGYDYCEAEDKDSGRNLVRRPTHSFSARADYRVTKKLSVNADVLYVGERNDKYYDVTMFTSSDVEVDGYTVVNIGAGYDVTENVRIFGRIDNLLDEDYQEIYGYGTPGISGYAGLKIQI